MFDEDGSPGPFLKVLLYAVPALAIGETPWERLTVDVWGAMA
ncbi:hypothetical protein ACFZAG_27500 [Streptomyces sp. NPDC012403]|uniref:Uncharacterized protein n=2 Tax=Streptomyces TaxID=1883 RepID=A0AA40SDR0_9ACTN|nr:MULTISPECIES: hypothetical protein [Streptomyces]MBA8944296.1 hypothetical protein [Streptomyces calvus]MBA8976658.1 hypothetical protein [Streptomyces calvus]GGP54560.1 hypothetical protein GCM10010247_29010 [Streptomyces calvus]